MLSIDGSTCPENENSTDCLLRVLLKVLNDQAETRDDDWDPLTFGFTVPIGIIAALFAFVTIFQAVLAAGPGRRKSNRNAIGDWSRLTTRKWSWPDMTMLSVTKTPVLRASRIIKLLDQPQRAENDYESYGEVAATWWSLLKEVDMLSLLYDKEKDMKETQCDYLPGDLRAAPAYAEVGCIIVMTAVAGAVSFKPEEQSAYPVIIGDRFQFDFRQHPALGIVGAFSQHGSAGNDRSIKPHPKRTLLALRHAQGDVEAGFCGFGRGMFVSSIRQADPGTIFRTGHGESGCAAKDPDAALCGCHALYERPDNHHLAWLMTAAVPQEVPVLFPSDSTTSSNVLTMLALNSRFWRAPRATRLNETESSILTRSQIQWYATTTPHVVKDGHIGYASALLSSREDRTDLPPKPQDIDLGEDMLDNEEIVVAYNDVYQGCLRLLYSLEDFKSWFTTLDDLEKQYLRILVLLQLKQVDRWLLRCPAQLVVCQVAALYLKTLTLLDAEEAITEDTFGFSLVREGSKMPSLSTKGMPTEIITRHATTIETLYCFASMNTCNEVFSNIKKLPGILPIADLVTGSSWRQFYCLSGRSPRFKEQLDDMRALFRNVLNTVNYCWEAVRDEQEEKHKEGGETQRREGSSLRAVEISKRKEFSPKVRGMHKSPWRWRNIKLEEEERSDALKTRDLLAEDEETYEELKEREMIKVLEIGQVIASMKEDGEARLREFLSSLIKHRREKLRKEEAEEEEEVEMKEKIEEAEEEYLEISGERVSKAAEKILRHRARKREREVLGELEEVVKQGAERKDVLTESDIRVLLDQNARSKAKRVLEEVKLTLGEGECGRGEEPLPRELKEEFDRLFPIERMLVWRCILIALLFWTAPDNSAVLLSGSWKHVIPII